MSSDDSDTGPNPWQYDQYTPPNQVPVEMLGAFVEFLRSDDPAKNMQGTLMIRKMLTVEEDQPVEEVVREGCVDIFVSQMLRDNEQPLQFESAWALTNISSDLPDVVVAAGAVPNFIRLLDSSSGDCSEQAAWAIGNLSGNGAGFRDHCIECGAIKGLMSLYSSAEKKGFTATVLRNVSWALSNLCRGKPLPKQEDVAPVLPVLVDMLNRQDHEVVADGAFALSYLSDCDETERIQAVLNTGCLGRLIELLRERNTLLVTPALKVVGSVVQSGDSFTQVVIDKGALPALRPLQSNPKRSIRKEVNWILSNIACGTHAQIDAVIAANLFPGVMNATRDTSADVQQEAVWALNNGLWWGTTSQLHYLIENGALVCLCDRLTNDLAQVVFPVLSGCSSVDHPAPNRVESCALDAIMKAFSEKQLTPLAFWEAQQFAGGFSEMGEGFEEPERERAAMVSRAIGALATVAV